MQPNQPPSQGPAQQPTPYDFFLNEQKQAARSKMSLPVNTGSTKGRVLLIIGGLIVLIILFVVVSSLLSSGSKTDNNQLLLVAQEQNELIRVAGLAEQNQTTDNTTLNLANNISLTVTSAQQQLVAVLKKHHIDTGTKQLQAKMNAATDQSLKAASANSEYDATFAQIIQSQLKAYQVNLNKAFAQDKTKSDRAVLQSAYQSATLLLSEPTSQSDQ